MPEPSKLNMSPSLWEKLRLPAYKRTIYTSSGIILLILAGIAISFLTSEINFTLTFVILATIASLAAIVACLKYPIFGVYFTILFSAVFAIPGRLLTIKSPIGILTEVFTYMLIASILGRSFNVRKESVYLLRSPIFICLCLVFGYYVLEVFNPEASHTKVAWFFFVRKQISYFFFFFITFILLNSFEKIKLYLKFWVILAFVIALYGVKQQWFGLADFEKVWIQGNSTLKLLYFQGGFLRKFSFLTDPAAFGIICVTFGLFCLIVALRSTRPLLKYSLYFITLFLFLGSFYSGTRTCNLMIIAGLLAYGLFTINEKKTIYLMVAASVLGVVMLLGPLQNNPVLDRAKSTFAGSNDASAKLRDINRHSIQPYIQSHPMGGGLNTSGNEGVLYSPTHKLAGFPPDSGYMKIVLEQGWIGFAINLLLYFVILKTGLDTFHRAKSFTIRNVAIALTTAMFALIVGQYSQISISQYPLILFYYSALGILIKLSRYDFDESKVAFF
jgi:putative inorganic carbon (HCO3(-)) transporter